MMMMDALYTKWGHFWEKIRGENSPLDNTYSGRLSGNIYKANKQKIATPASPANADRCIFLFIFTAQEFFFVEVF